MFEKNFENLSLYKCTMSVFRQWLNDGIITEEDYLALDTIMAKKYEISLCSIYRELT